MSDLSATLVIDPRDDVAVALRPVAAGDRVADGVVAARDIPVGHKVALRAIAAGEPVRKFGWPIGRATQAIAPGAHVHSHNLATALAGVETYAYEPAPAEALPPPSPATFQGYRRADGRVGVRNEIWVLCTVGCVANTARRIADKVAAAGGTPVLTEIPEVFGAENVLLQRAASRQVFDQAVEVIDDFKRYYHSLDILLIDD
ncbi:MAG: UxaA family hydrolase, partial [Phenylobacterium sp.]|uniref:UxaA family hydrolase n=1 Tax=Phenylobacterium sp. TaxID=1871053 RepID=UPI001A320AD3